MNIEYQAVCIAARTDVYTRRRLRLRLRWPKVAAVGVSFCSSSNHRAIHPSTVECVYAAKQYPAVLGWWRFGGYTRLRAHFSALKQNDAHLSSVPSLF